MQGNDVAIQNFCTIYLTMIIIVKNWKKTNNAKFDNDDHSQNLLHSNFESQSHFLAFIKVVIQISFMSLVHIFNARFVCRST